MITSPRKKDSESVRGKEAKHSLREAKPWQQDVQISSAYLEVFRESVLSVAQ
jgi:hypothetical protein